MSKDKYKSTFGAKTGAIVFIILHYFCNAQEKYLRTTRCLLLEMCHFYVSSSVIPVFILTSILNKRFHRS